jgi:hypothetical protein
MIKGPRFRFKQDTLARPGGGVYAALGNICPRLLPQTRSSTLHRRCPVGRHLAGATAASFAACPYGAVFSRTRWFAPSSIRIFDLRFRLVARCRQCVAALFPIRFSDRHLSSLPDRLIAAGWAIALGQPTAIIIGTRARDFSHAVKFFCVGPPGHGAPAT